MELHKLRKSQLIDEVKRLQAQIDALEADLLHAQPMEPAGVREEIFQGLLDTCPTIIYAKDLAGRYILLNHECAVNIGYPQEAIIGKTNYDFYPQRIAAKLEADDQQIIATNSVLKRAIDVDTAIGQHHYISLKFPIFDHQGVLQAIGGIATDITDRRLAEKRLAESERSYRLLYESNPLPMWIIDAEKLDFLSVNEAAIRHYGYSRQEFLAMSLWDMHPGSDAAILKQRLNVAGAQQSAWSGEVQHYKKDGRLIVVQIVAQPITYNNQAARLMVAQDITAWKDLEAALRESEERYQILSEATFEGLGIHEDGVIVDANDVLVGMFGYSREEFKGKHYTELMDPADVIAIMEQAQRGGAPTYEATAIRRDGSRFFIEAQPKTMIHKGRAMRVMAIRDITERKQTEQALQESQSQLLQVQKMESISKLTGGMAHDFNNLLTAIIGYSTLLRDNFDDRQEAYANIAEIDHAAHRAAALTRQFLAFSRRQIPEPTILNLNTIITDMERMLRRLISEDIVLTTMLDANLDATRIDRSQFEQVMMNLVINARDALPHGGSLTIATANVELDATCHNLHHIQMKTGAYVMMAISDTGIGMDAATQQRIFEPFFTTKRAGEGTGLGLSIVYSIVKQSDGYVWVYSQPAIGTTFKVYLPRVERTTEWQQADKPSQVSIEPHGSEVILLVEDDERVRTLARRVLEIHGYVVLAAADGNEALRICAAYPSTIQLIITDMVMPYLGGSDLIKLVRTYYPSIKSLCISGYTNHMIAQQSIAIPCQAFLQKPFTPQVLARKVREVLDASEA